MSSFFGSTKNGSSNKIESFSTGSSEYIPDQSLYHKQLVPIRDPVDLSQLESDIALTTTDRIANALGRLTYGQMIALANEIAAVGEITKQTLPRVLWEWSKGHA